MTSLRHTTEPAQELSQGDHALLDAARATILAVGWRRTTLTDVARRAGVSRMTLYRRWPDMQTLLADQARAFNAGTVGRVLPVLLERPGRHPGQQVGRTPCLQAVHVDAPDAAPGEIIDVLITESHAHSLAAVPATAAARPGGQREDPRACV